MSVVSTCSHPWPFCATSRWEKRRGASTIEMQVLRSTYNLLPGTGWISDVKRKVIEFALAPGFARFIERRGGEPLLAQLALTHLPFGNVPGRTLHGIVDAANAAFDKRPEDLTLDECAYLMAAIRYQLRFGRGGDENAHHRRLERARHGLLLALPESPARRRILARLDRMPDPTHSQFASRVTADPQRTAVHLARGEMVEIVGELSNVLAPSRHRAHAIAITLETQKNFRRKMQFEAELAEVEHAHHRSLTRPLAHGPRSQRAQIFAAGVKDDGALAFYYNNRDDAFLSGSKPTRDHLDRYHAEVETRAIGSLGKAILALPLAHHFAVDASVCNRSIGSGSVSNPDGDRGSENCDAASLIDLRTAFARSLNLPLLEACRHVPSAALKATFLAWRATLPPDLRSHEQLCRWVVLQAVVTPSHLLAGFHALGRALLMGEPAIARLPKMIETITWRNNSDGSLVTSNTPDSQIDLSPFLDDQRVRSTVREWLSAPISEEGTAHSLGDLRLPAIAKTGTISLQDGRVRDHWLLVSLRSGLELRSFLFLAGASHPSIPIELPGSNKLFSPALATLLHDLDWGRPR